MTTVKATNNQNNNAGENGVPTNADGIYNSTTTVPFARDHVSELYTPYVRKLDIDIVAGKLRPRKQVRVFFDDVDMSGFFENPNKITVAGNHTFADLISGDQDLLSVAGGNARILLVEPDYVLSNTTILYVTAFDGLDSRISTANTVRGVVTGNTATVVAYEHSSGYIRANSNNSHLILGLDANSTIDNYYVGNTIQILTGANAGRRGANIISYNAATRTARVSPAFAYRQANAIYSIGDNRVKYSANNWQSSFVNKNGFFAGVLHIPSPANNRVKFLTGDKIITITDSSVGPNSDEFTTKAIHKFPTARIAVNQTQMVASMLGQGNALVGGGSRDTGVGNALIFNPIGKPPEIIDLPTRLQPIAETFRIIPGYYPNGVFLHSVHLFFKTKDDVARLPVNIEIQTTKDEIPSGDIIPGAIAWAAWDNINTSDRPSLTRLESGLGLSAEPNSTATRFTFPAPVYLAPGFTYALAIRLPTNFYEIFIAELGQKIIGSNQTVQRIMNGSQGLFKSRNSLRYDLIPDTSLMFQLNCCEFPINTVGSFQMSETKSPHATLGGSYVTTAPEIKANTYGDKMQIMSDAIELPGTRIRYSYKARTTANNTQEALWTPFVPDRTIHFKERKTLVGFDYLPRSLLTKFDMSTTDPKVSPIVLHRRQEIVYEENIINNMPLSNTLINIVEGGNSYNALNTSIVFTSGSGSGANAYVASANNTTGEIESIIVDNPGSGYFDNVEISLVSASGNGAVLNVSHELNAFGGPALMRYISKPVTLADGFEGGDLRVYLTAIKPPASNIQVYYKVRNSADINTLDEINWKKCELFTSAYNYSANLKPIELEFRPSNSENALHYESGDTVYTTFNQYQIKLVGASSGTTIYDIPQWLDMRAIALPGDPNLSV